MTDGRLTRQTTLGEIFDEDVWSDVDDAEAKRRITIEDLLQMESGYVEDGGYLGHVLGGLEGALDFGKYDASETGSFHYVNHHILSYVILELTGQTPLMDWTPSARSRSWSLCPGARNLSRFRKQFVGSTRSRSYTSWTPQTTTPALPKRPTK